MFGRNLVVRGKSMDTLAQRAIKENTAPRGVESLGLERQSLQAVTYGARLQFEQFSARFKKRIHLASDRADMSRVGVVAVGDGP